MSAAHDQDLAELRDQVAVLEVGLIMLRSWVVVGLILNVVTLLLLGLAWADP